MYWDTVQYMEKSYQKRNRLGYWKLNFHQVCLFYTIPLRGIVASSVLCSHTVACLCCLEDSNVSIFRSQYAYVSLSFRKKNTRVLLLSCVLWLSISENPSGYILRMAGTVADWVSCGRLEVCTLSVGRQSVVVRLLPFLSHCQNMRLESQIAFPLGLSAGRWDQAVTFLSVGKWKCTGKLDPSCCWKESLDGNTCTLNLRSCWANLLLARRQTGSGQWEWLASQYTKSALPSRPEQYSKKGSSFFTLTFGFVF